MPSRNQGQARIGRLQMGFQFVSPQPQVVQQQKLVGAELTIFDFHRKVGMPLRLGLVVRRKVGGDPELWVVPHMFAGLCGKVDKFNAPTLSFFLFLPDAREPRTSLRSDLRSVVFQSTNVTGQNNKLIRRKGPEKSAVSRGDGDLEAPEPAPKGGDAPRGWPFVYSFSALPDRPQPAGDRPHRPHLPPPTILQQRFAGPDDGRSLSFLALQKIFVLSTTVRKWRGGNEGRTMTSEQRRRASFLPSRSKRWQSDDDVPRYKDRVGPPIQAAKACDDGREGTAQPIIERGEKRGASRARFRGRCMDEKCTTPPFRAWP
ncbi:hypothetical protein CSOJ01_13441 [Colletotrichum sojae]|uniref:Uncharacterized protein n=1 Tax=Colletotrichum sojae TaxID=2175907 RepID=A0A8H6ISZ2_9PEZI|nr:hypothetical protein CSOJ01_13441 [Colletotrichum sojae]